MRNPVTNNKYFKATAFIILLILPFAVVYYILQTTVNPAQIFDLLHRLEDQIGDEDWASAEGTVDELVDRWQKVKLYITLNAGFDSLLDFEVALARMQKSVQAEEVLNAHLELETVRAMWREFITF